MSLMIGNRRRANDFDADEPFDPSPSTSRPPKRSRPNETVTTTTNAQLPSQPPAIPVDSTPFNETFPSQRVHYANSIRLLVAHIKTARDSQIAVFADEAVQPGVLVVEFVGELLRVTVAQEREKQYRAKGLLVSMFKYDDDYVIDASKHGNAARFIRHSCQPNCEAISMRTNGLRRIFLRSTSVIERGDELTYDYKLSAGNQPARCRCGRKNCRSFL
ncbi:SET domain-containing protein [Aphelenchoides besseyi]|nr:SET domain-containing protein [Aphelenchoides besseyi]